MHYFVTAYCVVQARQTRQNSGRGGVAEVKPRFDKGGGGLQSFLILRDKNIYFLEFLRNAIKKGQLLGISHNKKVHFLEFICKAVKKANF